MKKISKIYIALSVLFFPIITFAVNKDLNDIVNLAIKYFKTAIILIMALAVLMFVWNVFKYFIKGDDVAEKKEAGLYVMWSVIGFFVILSMWGLVNLVIKTFDLDNTEPAGFFGVFKSSSGSRILFDAKNMQNSNIPTSYQNSNIPPSSKNPVNSRARDSSRARDGLDSQIR